jgi:hypothetical protein
VIPLHPAAVRLTQAQVDSLTGEYLEAPGVAAITVFWQGDRLWARDRYGDIAELAAQSPTELFYPNGSIITRLIAERGADGRVVALTLHDDRHEERWEKRKSAPTH